MAASEAGDMFTSVYQLITEGMVDVYEKNTVRIMLETLDPRDIDRTMPQFLARMLLESAAQAAAYTTISKNYMNAFLDAESGPSQFDKQAVQVVSGAFNPSIMTKKMVGAMNYGYKMRISNGGGPPMMALGPRNEFFMAAVNEGSKSAVQTILQPGRDVIPRTAQANPGIIRGYGRKPNGGACDFCMMLSGRANYSEATMDFKSHTNCKCVGEPITSPTWQPSPESIKGYSDFLDRQARLDAKYGAGLRKGQRRISKEARDVGEGRLSKEELDVRQKERWVKKHKAITEKAYKDGGMDDEKYEKLMKQHRAKEIDNNATRKELRADRDARDGKITEEEAALKKEQARLRAEEKLAELKPAGTNGVPTNKEAKAAILGR